MLSFYLVFISHYVNTAISALEYHLHAANPVSWAHSPTFPKQTTAHITACNRCVSGGICHQRHELEAGQSAAIAIWLIGAGKSLCHLFSNFFNQINIYCCTRYITYTSVITTSIIYIYFHKCGKHTTKSMSHHTQIRHFWNLRTDAG